VDDSKSIRKKQPRISSFYAAFFFGEWYHLSALAALVDLAWCSQLHGLVCQHLYAFIRSPCGLQEIKYHKNPACDADLILTQAHDTDSVIAVLFCTNFTQKFHSKPAFFDSIFGY